MNNVETIKVVPARYPLRTVGAIVALFVLAVVVQSVAFNPRWEWSVFARWFFDQCFSEPHSRQRLRRRSPTQNPPRSVRPELGGHRQLLHPGTESAQARAAGLRLCVCSQEPASRRK